MSIPAQVRADTPALGVDLQLIGPAEGLDVSSLVIGSPELQRTLDGPTVLTIELTDPDRYLLQNGVVDSRNFTGVDGVRLEQAALSIRERSLVLTFEDAIVRALKRRRDPKVWAAGTLTRQQLAKALAAEAGVAIDVDPEKRGPIADAVTRNMTSKASASGVTGQRDYTADPTSDDTSWSLLGSLASDIDWRCCSDGERILFGSDAWLMARQPAIPLAERESGVVSITAELDDDQAANRASVTVDVDLWAIPPGQAVSLTRMGPADGDWLVESFRRPLRVRKRGTVDLIRARVSLVEPVKPPEGATGDAGELDYLDDPYTIATPSTSARAAERANGTPLGKFMDYALAAVGRGYVLGANGPNAYDCSGLVQQAARAAGLNFPKPVIEQVGRIRRGQGRLISVKEALMTRGALLYRATPGGSNGNGNHIAISLGDGNRTVEARGKAYGTGIFGNAAGRQWDGGFIIDFSRQVNAVGSGQIGGPR